MGNRSGKMFETVEELVDLAVKEPGRRCVMVCSTVRRADEVMGYAVQTLSALRVLERWSKSHRRLILDNGSVIDFLGPEPRRLLGREFDAAVDHSFSGDVADELRIRLAR